MFIIAGDKVKNEEDHLASSRRTFGNLSRISGAGADSVASIGNAVLAAPTPEWGVT